MLTRTGVLFLLVAVLATVSAGTIGIYDWRHMGVTATPPRTQAVVTGPPSAAPTPQPSATPTPLPASSRIQTVPFTIQAPFQVWDAAHEEYCEAAAVYMVGQYFKGDLRPTIPPAEADAAMGRIVAYERSTFPGVMNLSLADMQQVGANFYGLHSQVLPLDLHVIEQDLANGLPVIVPVVTHGGPGGSMIYPTYGRKNVYHVIVLVGYDDPQGAVYTNDAGLREGQYLKYPWSTLSTAIAAQANTAVDESGTPVPRQGRTMLVFTR